VGSNTPTADSGDTIPQPHSDISPDPTLEKRIDAILAEDTTSPTDPIERLPPVSIPNLMTREELDRRVEAWMAEIIAREDIALRYISPKCNANARIQYHYVGDAGAFDARFVRCMTTEQPTVWDSEPISQRAVVSTLVDRLTWTTPPGTDRRDFDGTLDWVELCMSDSLKPTPEISGNL
jgi:hypothetical protein